MKNYKSQSLLRSDAICALRLTKSHISLPLKSAQIQRKVQFMYES